MQFATCHKKHMNWNGNKEAKNKKHKLFDLEKKKTKKKKKQL